MKKIITLFILISLLIITVPSLFSDDMWMRLYDRINTLEYRYSVLQSMMDTDDPGTIPVFQKALDDTNRTTLTNLTSEDKRFYDEIQKISIKKLGDFKVKEAEDAIFQAYSNTGNLVIKTESIEALGKMGSDKFIEEFIITLRNINMRIDSNANISDNESMAYALVNYFEKIRNEKAYEVVFYAAVGWYSPRSEIKENAKNSLKVISNDPSVIIKSILEKDPDFDNKYIALTAEKDSYASDEKKSNTATAGLKEGLRHKVSTIPENMKLLNLRLLACKMLINSSYKDPAAVPYLEQILYDNFDVSEKLTVIETLGTFKSNESVATLIKYLKDQNNKQADGMSPYIDRRTVIATINALGESGNPAAREELIVTTTIQTWSAAVLQSARTALDKLNKAKLQK